MSEGRLRILHMTYAADAGGLSRYIHDLAVATREAGHEVAVAGDTGAWQWLFDRAKLPYVHVPYKAGPTAVLTAARIVRRWVRTHWGGSGRGGTGGRPGGADLFHSHYRRPTLAARLLQRVGQPAPVLYTLHLSHLPLRLWNRWLTDFGDHTHVASSEAYDWARADARVPADRLSLIPHGVHVAEWPVATDADRAAARRALGLEQTARVAVYVGRLDQRHPKNVPWLLDLAERYAKVAGPGEPELRVLIAGEGPDEPELQARIQREGLADRVRLLGHVHPLTAYQAGDLLLLPSGREGFSLVCAEAMATGLPVCRTATAGTKELIIEGVTGHSTPIDREAFLATALRLLRDGPGLASLRPAAARHVREHFTFDRQFRETLALYHRLAATRRHA